MGAKIRWTGLDELRADLRRLPAELTGEASGIVTSAANAARDDIASAYPKRTGNLAGNVRVLVKTIGAFGVAVIVRNTAKHAHLFEYGTQARHTDLGANRGSMPPGNVFIPRIIKWRRAMYAQLKAMLVRHGLKASGEA